MRITTPIYDVPLWTRIDGAIAVVTGGARGTDRAVALSLVDAGARVVIADLDAAHPTRSWRKSPNGTGNETGELSVIEGISAVILATHEMPRAVRFYRALGCALCDPQKPPSVVLQFL